ncbi:MULTISPECIES: hypothetical protein [Bacillaceae]|uniref:hypothetical protein n=1 Tax=Bacillaceae TaxID=186817 RepID=UPI000BEB318E|nr:MULTISPECIES: hypothetical protein [unclassified Bacillus (in: firmicutes)]PEC51749.1 hypothetical protein CON00_01115 [Bacillus sp. AFS096315]PFM79850.1 hypothetical protein COJ46_12690 [Bacillus sp. AFS077874]
MKEKLDSIFLNSANSQIELYSSIASIILGVIIFFVALHFKKKQKNWWVIVSLIGMVAIIINGVKLIN